LRAAEGGRPLLLSAGGGAPPLDANAWSGVEPVLGASVALEEQCKYAAASSLGGAAVSLWDAVIGTQPPLRVHQDELATFQVGGQDYAVWFDAGTRSTLSIYAQ
jgi:hypothetical protein